MKILDIDTQIKKIPLRRAFVTALRRVENVEFVRVRVQCEDGTISYGEAPATKAITGEDLQSISQAIQENKKLFYAKKPEDALVLLHKLKIGSSAKAALDMAFYLLLDSFMHSQVQGIHEKNKTKTKTAITISLNEKAKMLYDAKDAYYNGHTILKLKFGADILHAIDVTTIIQEQLPHSIILVDANQAWSLSDSKTYLDAFQGTDIDLVEQPVKANALDALKELRDYSDIPIVADESCFTLEDVKKVVQTKAADIINIKLMKCGGITKAKEILEYCREVKIPVMFGSMLEGPLSISYACYLVDEYADVVKYVDLDSPLLYR